MQTWNQILTTSKRLIASALLISFAAGCVTMPTTPDQAYKACRVIHENGKTLVRGRLQFVGGQGLGVGFGALIEPNKVQYMMIMLEGPVGVERGVFEKIGVPKGFGIKAAGREIFFPPAYFIGLLRRIDEEIAKRKNTSR